MLGIFGKKDKVGGQIAAHGLSKWWLSTFTPAERDAVATRADPESPAGRRALVDGESVKTMPTRLFLSHLSSRVNTPTLRPAAKRILFKAIETGDGDTLDEHFLYHQVIEVFYADRETDPDALDRAIWACEKQIDLQGKAAKAFKKKFPKVNLPSHTGYEQLAILREKQGRLDDAITLSRDAKKHGWAGDWDKRIARLETKRDKAK